MIRCGIHFFAMLSIDSLTMSDSGSEHYQNSCRNAEVNAVKLTSFNVALNLNLRVVVPNLGVNILQSLLAFLFISLHLLHEKYTLKPKTKQSLKTIFQVFFEFFF